MSSPVTARQFEVLLNQLQPGPDQTNRGLALFAGAIAIGDEQVILGVVSELRSLSIPRADLYEITLQSYLFLGFPRMLIAAECLASAWPESPDSAVTRPSESGPKRSLPNSSSKADFVHWKTRGADLYKLVYGKNADRLRERVMSFAPEIFDWMITEGYGKVLSRPGLDMVTREIAIVAFLTVDNRPKQLLSHLKGALLVGATREQLQTTVDDLTTIAPDGAAVARDLLCQLGETR